MISLKMLRVPEEGDWSTSLHLVPGAVAALDCAHNARGVAGHDRPRRHVARDDRAGAHGCTLAYGHATCAAPAWLGCKVGLGLYNRTGA